MIRSLLTISLLSIITTTAEAQIYKCVVKGKTTYSESPCKEGDYENNRFDVTDERMGNVTYDRQTIEGARARIRAGMNEGGVVVGTGSPKPIGAGATARNATPETRRQQCTAISERKKNLDAMARQQNSGYWLDWYREQKMQADRDAYDWGC